MADDYIPYCTRENFLRWMQQSQKNLSPFFAALAVLSCFTSGGVNNFTADKNSLSGFLDKTWVSTMFAFFLTTLWDTMNVATAWCLFLVATSENPSAKYNPKVLGGFLFHNIALFPAVCWATYTIFDQKVAEQPNSSVTSDVLFGVSELIAARQELQKYYEATEKGEAEEARKTLSPLAASALCALGAFMGAASMKTSDEWPLRLCAALYVAHAIAHNADRFACLFSAMGACFSRICSSRDNDGVRTSLLPVPGHNEGTTVPIAPPAIN